MNSTVRILRNICLLIALYLLSYYVYTGILNPVPTLGDDWDYHIPISQSILDGSFIHPPHYPSITHYYPGSAEAINSILMVLHVPLTLSSIFAIIALFYSCYQLAKTYELDKNLSLVYAACFSTLTVILRWANKVSIDTWVVVFFLLSLALLIKPRGSLKYFLTLGFVLGMLIGSKYTGIFFTLVLLGMFGKKLLSYLTMSRVIVFLIPFSLFGLFWYIRNVIAVGNPLPVCVSTPGCTPDFFYLWQELFHDPLTLLNALFGEYKLWLFAPVFLLVYLIKLRNKKYSAGVVSLSVIGIVCLLFYFSLPTATSPWQNVSTVRYTLPAFAVMILAVFIIARQQRWDEYVGYVVIANMLPVLSMAYYPKLIFIYFPIGVFLISTSGKSFLMKLLRQ